MCQSTTLEIGNFGKHFKTRTQQRNSRETKGDYVCIYCIQPKECSNIGTDPNGESLVSKILGGMHKEKCG
jgi:hypothetical protein